MHGCADELDALLSKIGYADGDRVIFVGDLVVRGPKPNEVLALARKLGAASVRGNHEHRLLRFRALRKGTQEGRNKGKARSPHEEDEAKLLKSKMLKRTAKALDQAGWRYIKNLPLWLDIEEHGLRVVHAGVVPGRPIEQQSEISLMYLRSLDEHGAPSFYRHSGPPWGTRYQGPPHVVFGHNAMGLPQLHPWATGLDTGCVYGGNLTAMVLPAGGQVPPVADRRDALVSVPAREAYVPI